MEVYIVGYTGEGRIREAEAGVAVTLICAPAAHPLVNG